MLCHHYIYKCRGLSSIIDDSSYVLPQYIKEKITTQQGFKENLFSSYMKMMCPPTLYSPQESAEHIKMCIQGRILERECYPPMHAALTLLPVPLRKVHLPVFYLQLQQDLRDILAFL